jgi:alpha-L-rhamnosidase
VILDLGQEIVGWPKITFNAEKGTSLEVFFAELLNDSGVRSRGNDGPKGSMYIENYRSALARYFVIASGEENETRAPSHCFYGFRYIEIRPDRDIELVSVVGQVVGSDLTEGGTFTCDDPEVNQLYSNIVWGMRGNYLYIPTDCPQRNERLGWTGDTQIFCGAASYIANIRPFMHKWLLDARDSQQGYEGAYGDIIPRTNIVGCGNAAWGDAGIIVPYRLWLMYHDEEIVRTHYDSMEYYMEYLTRNGLKGPNPVYGDWLNYDITDKAYISACYYAYDADLMARFSNILGKTDRAEHYAKLREDIVNEWKKNYIKDGYLTINTQCAYLLAFAFDLVPAELEKQFKERLRSLIVDNDYTLSTGFVGTGVLCQTLDKADMNDLAYSLLLQTKDPSWLYSVRQGATTVWERWNSYTKEKGFGDVGMNSFNHYAYGAVAEWLYSGVCGICPDENDTGFRHFIVRPNPDLRTFIPEGQKRICSAKATYTSDHGKIESAWALKDGAYYYTVVIPEGTSATVSLITDSDVLTFNTLEVKAEELNAKRNGNRLEFELGAGKYVIKA